MPFPLAAVVLVLFMGTVPAFGGQSQPYGTTESSLAEAEAEIVQAPVVIDGEVLFSVRGISVYPAEQRAQQIEARIRTLARDAGVDAASLTLEDRPEATWIVVNGRRLLIVHDADATLEGIDRHTLAEAYRARMSEAIERYRDARQPAVLWRHALFALAATLAFLAGTFVGWRGFRRLRARLERQYRERVHDVSIQSFPVVRADQLWRALSGMLSVVWVVTVAVMAFTYLRYTLALFPWTHGAADHLVSVAIHSLRSMGLGLVELVPNFVFLTILFFVTRSVLKVTRLFFGGVSAGTVRLRNFDPDWASPTYRLVRVLIIVFALVVAFPYVPGSETDAFKGVTIFIGLVFSLGSSSLIGNLISGYSMTYRRTFHVGDRVKIGEHVGEVKEMRLLVTHLRTPRNEEVIVPNSAIVGAEVVNYSSMAKESGLILHTTVGIGYATPWRQVEAMLLEAAARTPGLLQDRPPFVYQTALGDFS
ncbi:MAG: mechanosensitive ion channel family protein, partial [Acidobacteria bacterium]